MIWPKVGKIKDICIHSTKKCLLRLCISYVHQLPKEFVLCSSTNSLLLLFMAHFLVWLNLSYCQLPYLFCKGWFRIVNFNNVLAHLHDQSTTKIKVYLLVIFYMSFTLKVAQDLRCVV